jgi:hypothetical protein
MINTWSRWCRLWSLDDQKTWALPTLIRSMIHVFQMCRADLSSCEFSQPPESKTLTSLLRWVKKSGPYETTGIRKRLDGYNIRISWFESTYRRAIYMACMNPLYQYHVVPNEKFLLEEAKSAYISECRLIMGELLE